MLLFFLRRDLIAPDAFFFPIKFRAACQPMKIFTASQQPVLCFEKQDDPAIICLYAVRFVRNLGKPNEKSNDFAELAEISPFSC